VADNGLLIGIDFGTGSSKGVLVRPNGEMVAQEAREHRTSNPRPGFFEHDAEDVWWHDFTSIVEALLAKADGPIVGVCTSGIGPCQLPADADGQPLRPAILYGVDTRAYKEVAELTEKYGDDEVVRRCGNSLTAQSQGAKWLWLVRNQPWIYEKTRYFFMSHTFTVFRLTGEYVLDHLSASMCEPMYSPAARDWIPEWCEDVAPGLPLPRLMYSNQVAGHITAEGARRTGLPEGIPVAVGTIDAFSEALSVGVKDPGQIMLMYGSTIVADLITERAVSHPALWSLTGTYENTFSLAGGLSASGALTTWLRDIVGGVEYAVLTEEAEEVAAGSNGLLALPYFAGERTPISDPHARGVIAGLTLGTTRGELYRALLEATAFGTRHLLQSMAEAGAAGKRCVAVGGGTKGGVWTQIMSDVCGIEQDLPKYAIGAAYGDALLAAQVAGLADESTNWAQIAHTVRPNPDNKQIYDDLFGHYLDLYPATKDLQHHLSGLHPG
jgi:xylulokinase